MGFTGSTIQQGVGTSVVSLRDSLPRFCAVVVLRADSSNTNDVFVSLGKHTANTSDLKVRAGENLTIDITNMLLLKKSLGLDVTEDDFIKELNVVSDAANQTLYVDAFGW